MSEGEPVGSADIDDDTREPGSVVSSAEIVRSFAKWREISLTSPVQITSHGRTSHILIGARLYQQLTRSDGAGGDVAMDTKLTGLSEWLREGLILCNSNEEILYANQRAKEFLGLQTLRPGANLLEAIPELEGSVMQTQYRRTFEAKETLMADLPSPRRKGRWVNFQTIPFGDRLVIMFRDITEEVKRYRMADAKAAMLEAIERHPCVSYLSLSPRGMIETFDSSLEKWLQLSRKKLAGVRISDLVVRENQHSFINTLDEVFEDDCARNCDVRLMANKAEPLSVHCAIVPMRGAYGMEGASVIMTRN
ncbi:MAG: PAS domain-containing protein [Alteraurantiacibacter sp.]